MFRRFRFVSCVIRVRGVISEIALSPSSRYFSCVICERADISEIALFQRFRFVSCVSPAKGVVSEMALPPRCRCASCVICERADISEIALSQRLRFVSCVSPAKGVVSEIRICVSHNVLRCVSPKSGEKSDTVLLLTARSSASIYAPPRSSCLRLCACSSPVRSSIPRLRTSRCVRFSSVCVVIALPICSRIAAAKFGSGMDTTSACDTFMNKRLNNTVILRDKCLTGIKNLHIPISVLTSFASP